ncbi:unnamed protein product [Prorocentrum cordatum]|uniref:t-SNARE coiled-coil homology domain-containing protein n=1 Tax=Prorocentrum cordatum TaxID=2364126 RepID=A0ABN9WLB9_9DINO|nr:unnamed protein product [Polarella glacialis]
MADRGKRAGGNTGSTPVKQKKKEEEEEYGEMAMSARGSNDKIVAAEAPPQWFMDVDARISKQIDGITTDLNGVKHMIDQARIEAQDARRAAEEVQDKMEEVEMNVEGIRNDPEEMYLTKTEIEEIIDSKLQGARGTMRQPPRACAQKWTDQEEGGKTVRRYQNLDEIENRRPGPGLLAWRPLRSNML